MDTSKYKEILDTPFQWHSTTSKKVVELINQIGKENGVLVTEIHTGWEVTRKGFKEVVVETTLDQLIDRLYWVVGMAVPDLEVEDILYQVPAVFVYEMYKSGWRYRKYSYTWINEKNQTIDHATAVQYWSLTHE